MRTISPLPRHRRCRWARLSLSVAPLVVVALFSSASSAQELQQSQRPQFGAAVARVRVDVIVTDDGEFVDDLRADEFVMYEDGREQDILAVQLVDLLPEGSGSSPGNPLAAPPRAEARVASAQGRDAQGRELTLQPTDLAAVVYVVNGLGVGCRGMSRFARQWGRMYGDIEQVEVPYSVLLIDYLGYVHELASFTHDVNTLRKAAERVRGKPLFSDAVEKAYEQNFGGVCFGPPISNAAERTFQLLTAITDALAARPGRKALVWVSADIPMVARDTRRGASFDGFDSMRADRVRRDFERSANTAGVSVYGLDPGLITWHTSLSSAASSSGPADRILRDPYVGSFSASRNDLNQVSRNTGGTPFVRWSSIPKALRQVERETARFYLVTYAPPDPPNDGDYHEIRVEVTRPDLEVRARDGYYDISEAERLQRAEAGRLVLQETSPLLRSSGGG